VRGVRVCRFRYTRIPGQSERNTAKTFTAVEVLPVMAGTFSPFESNEPQDDPTAAHLDELVDLGKDHAVSYMGPPSCSLPLCRININFVRIAFLMRRISLKSCLKLPLQVCTTCSQTV